MNLTACEDRGADLFLVARGGAPAPDLAAHLAACGGCRADLERLRGLARDLPAASAGLAPRPATRSAVMAEAALPPRAEAPPPLPRRRTGGILRFVLPIAAAAAGIGITAFVLGRPPSGTPAPDATGAITVTTDFGRSALEGLGADGLRSGSVLTARRLAAVRLGPPFQTRVVLGEGTRLRLSSAGGTATAEILEGIAWFEPSPPGTGPGSGRVLKIVAGGLEVSPIRGSLTVELRASGAAGAIIETGSALVKVVLFQKQMDGPSRVYAMPGGNPVFAAADPSDATAWFSRPEADLAVKDGRLEITLKADLPASLRIAPWSPVDPGFSIRAERAGADPVTIPLAPAMLAVPAPAADADGSFLLSASRSYRITVDGGALGLQPGRYALAVVYAPRGGPGLWRGTCSSKPVEWEVK